MQAANLLHAGVTTPEAFGKKCPVVIRRFASKADSVNEGRNGLFGEALLFPQGDACAREEEL
jgi:hypothetical protein